MVAGLLAIFCMTPAWAVETTVQTEAYAENAAAAQEKALRTGEKMALYQVLYAKMPKDAERMVLSISEQARQNLITGFDIVREVKRGKYYQADIRYTFDDALIGRLLKNYETVAAGDAGSQAILVLPVFDDGMALHIWDEANPWRDAMRGAALRQGEGRVVVPNGTADDLKLVDEAVVLSANIKALGEMASHYGARTIMIAQTSATKKADKAGFRVILRKAGAGKEEEQVRDFFPAGPQETSEQVLNRAATETATYVRDSSKNFGAFLDAGVNGSKHARVVRAEFRNNREWGQLQTIVSQVPGVAKMDMNAVSANYAVMTLFFNGSDAVIRKMMVSRGVKVRETGKYWTVSMR